MPEEESREIFEIFRAYGLKDEEIQPVVAGLERNHEHWIDFMMKYELALDKPDPNRGLISALVIAGSYIVGGVVPLLPYMIYRDSHFALMISALVFLVMSRGASLVLSLFAVPFRPPWLALWLPLQPLLLPS
jgi:VIT1/CCC1 family predicted Fe2+/Mn2+ transporter